MEFLILFSLSALASPKLKFNCEQLDSSLNMYRCENKEVVCYVFKDSIWTLSRGAVGTSGMECKFKIRDLNEK